MVPTIRYGTLTYLRYSMVPLPVTVLVERYLMFKINHLLGDGGIVVSTGRTLILPDAQEVPPAALHGRKHRHIQWLHEVGGIFGEEDEPES